jgi:hypothetical protein
MNRWRPPGEEPKSGHSSALPADRAFPSIQNERHADNLDGRDDGVFPSNGFTTACKP